MKTFVDQQSYTAWLDSLYHKDTKEKHFIKVRDQSVDTNTVLGRYLSSPTRTDVKQLLPEPWRNSSPQTIGELNAIKYLQGSVSKEKRDFAIQMEDLREPKLKNKDGLVYANTGCWTEKDNCTFLYEDEHGNLKLESYSNVNT
jgi:hypothetical protein